MYQYYHNPKNHLIVVRHFNDFIGAESTNALIFINRHLSSKAMHSTKNIAIDFRKVSSATLYDTDRALHSLLHAELVNIPPNLRLVRLYDIENPATKMLEERVTRTNDMISRDFNSTIKAVSIYYEQELLALLNLPQDTKIFDDSHDWQNPPKNIDLLG